MAEIVFIPNLFNFARRTGWIVTLTLLAAGEVSLKAIDVSQSKMDVDVFSQPITLTQSNTSSDDSAGFNEVPPWRSAIRFENKLNDDRSLQNQILLNGSGVALGDVTGDGLPDIYLCGLDTSNRLYRNLGDWHFVDITESAGVACAGQDSTSAARGNFCGIARDRPAESRRSPRIAVTGLQSGPATV